MNTYHNLTRAIDESGRALLTCGRGHTTNTWQAVQKPMQMHELILWSFKAMMPASVALLQDEVSPNLPWADAHFEERVSGIPHNPPPSHKIWPHAVDGNKEHRKEVKTRIKCSTCKGSRIVPGDGELTTETCPNCVDGTMANPEAQFSHTYPERMWPRYANDYGRTPRHGIRFDYGDLGDLVEMLKEDPTTRQAYLPIWFPEDLVAGRNHLRVPCTLGYHFIFRQGYLHCSYYIRSCDFLRHFRDDIYLACRLTIWVLQQTKLAGVPGILNMHIASLHVFQRDMKQLEAYA